MIDSIIGMNKVLNFLWQSASQENSVSVFVDANMTRIVLEQTKILANLNK